MRAILRGLLTAAVLLTALSAQAADEIGKNITLLHTAEDFRVRTQAALALGASDSQRAVLPLCKALDDSNSTVRIASGTALSRLKKGGMECLERRIQSESESRVLSALKRALSNLGPVEPAIGSETKYWVAIQRVAGPPRLENPVRAAFIRGASERRDVAFAPRSLSLAQAEKILSGHPATKGFLLAPKLAKPSYEGGMLKIKISVAIMTYPGSSLIGSFSKTVGMSGVTAPDQQSENELVELASEEAMKQFLAIAGSL